MKSLRSIGILLLLVVALIGYTYFFEYKKDIAEETKKAVESEIVSVDRKAITEIILVNGDKIIDLVREGEQWHLHSPVTDLADNDEVNSLLDDIYREKSKSIVAEGEKADLNIYGLKDPKGSLTIKTHTGETFKYLLSARKNFEGNPFVVKENTPRIYLVSATWDAIIEKPIKTLRDKRIIRDRMEDLVSFHIEINKKAIVDLINKDSLWYFAGDDKIQVDQGATRTYIDEVRTSRIEEFLVEQPDESKVINWDAAKLVLQFKDGHTWTLHVSKGSDGKVYFKSSIRPLIFSMNGVKNKLFLEKTSMDFRDKGYPFAYDPSGIEQINIVSTKLNQSFHLQNGSWYLNTNDTAKTLQATLENPVNQERVKKLLGALRELRVAEFSLHPQGKSADFSKNQIYLRKMPSEEIVFSLAWSEIYKVGKKDFYYVKTSQSPDVFGVDAGSLNQLLAGSFLLEKKEPNKEKDKKNDKDKKGDSGELIFK